MKHTNSQDVLENLNSPVFNNIRNRLTPTLQHFCPPFSNSQTTHLPPSPPLQLHRGLFRGGTRILCSPLLQTQRTKYLGRMPTMASSISSYPCTCKLHP